MKFILCALGVFGLYCLLSMFGSLRTTVLFTAFGMSFSLFFVLLAVGSLGIAKLTLSD